MKTRIISGATLLVILLLTLIPGGFVTGVFLMLVSILGMLEILKVYKMYAKASGVLAYIACFIYYLLLILQRQKLIYLEQNNSAYSLGIIVFCFLALMILFVISYPKMKSNEIFVSIFALIYAGILLSYVYKIRVLDGGIVLVWIIFISSWICDTCAYFSGVFLGKHKAFPVLSPKKTWEGCIGGVLGSTLIALLYAIIFNKALSNVFSNPYVAIPLIVFVCSIFSMFGDLAASAIKRERGIKDYSRLIPGHGGIMDRFDSVIFVSPVIYYMIIILMQ